VIQEASISSEDWEKLAAESCGILDENAKVESLPSKKWISCPIKIIDPDEESLVRLLSICRRISITAIIITRIARRRRFAPEIADLM
jgi:hypothetical protein